MCITINLLRSKLEVWLRKNGDRPDCRIDNFYIGKTENVAKRKQEHDAEGYADTIEIAHGLPAVVEKAETSLVAYFLASNMKDKCDNVDPKANGNNKADKLYVAYRGHYAEGGEELEEGVLTWPESYELLGEKDMQGISDKLAKDTLTKRLSEIKRK